MKVTCDDLLHLLVKIVQTSHCCSRSNMTRYQDHRHVRSYTCTYPLYPTISIMTIRTQLTEHCHQCLYSEIMVSLQSYSRTRSIVCLPFVAVRYVPIMTMDAMVYVSRKQFEIESVAQK
jgi:hypothetical protein